MTIPVEIPLQLFADATAASNAMRSYLMPVIATLVGLASLACTFFLITGGMQYMSSSGDPQKLERAKAILRNALVGLALVVAAGTLTAILSNAYSSANQAPTEKLPQIVQVEPKDGGIGAGQGTLTPGLVLGKDAL